MPLIFILFLLLFTSCDSLKPKKEKEGRPVARVYDKYLYKEDISGLIPPGTSKEDSSSIVTNYINNWVRQTVLLVKAEENLSDESKIVEQQLEDYRRSLIIYRYENELVAQNLDTVVTDEEIEAYYKENPQNFELKDNIIKVSYIKVDKKAPQINKVKKWFRSNDPEDTKRLEEYAYQFAQNFFLDDNTWLLFEDLLKEIPINTYNKEEFLKQNRYIEAEDSASYFFVNIKGFRIKNSISPLSFEKENIRNILLNKRKLELINKMKQDIYENALRKKDFEIYE